MSRMASGPMSFLAAAADLTWPSYFAWCALNVGVCACVSMTSTNDQAPDRRTSLSVPNTPKKGRRILASREGLESAQTHAVCFKTGKRNRYAVAEVSTGKPGSKAFGNFVDSVLGGGADFKVLKEIPEIASS